MRKFFDEFRMLLIDLLIDVQLWLLPVNHKHTLSFLEAARMYAEEVSKDDTKKYDHIWEGQYKEPDDKKPHT